MKDGEVATNYRQIKFPMTAAQGDVGFDGNTTNCTLGTLDGNPYMQIACLNSLKMHLDASGKNKDDWGAGHTFYKLRLIDNAEPVQTGMAYMSLCKYKAGDKVTITVLFNEIVNSASNVKVGAISGISAGNWQYVDGYGTNALTFTGTATADFTITTTVNNNLANVKPLSGTFYDMN
jgi:hypothetical protein